MSYQRDAIAKARLLTPEELSAHASEPQEGEPGAASPLSLDASLVPPGENTEEGPEDPSENPSDVRPLDGARYRARTCGLRLRRPTLCGTCSPHHRVWPKSDQGPRSSAAPPTSPAGGAERSADGCRRRLNSDGF